MPEEVRQLADKAYKLFSENPPHPSLVLKKVGPYWSARISRDYRVLGYHQSGNELFWFWISPHDEYDRILKG